MVTSQSFLAKALQSLRAALPGWEKGQIHVGVSGVDGTLYFLVRFDKGDDSILCLHGGGSSFEAAMSEVFEKISQFKGNL